MNIDLTQIVVALIGLLSAVITTFLVPYLKSKLTEDQQKKLDAVVKIGVYAAEQIFPPEKWEEKKQYAQQIVQEAGYDISLESINAAIEAAVKELRIAQGK